MSIKIKVLLCFLGSLLIVTCSGVMIWLMSVNFFIGIFFLVFVSALFGVFFYEIPDIIDFFDEYLTKLKEQGVKNKE